MRCVLQPVAAMAFVVLLGSHAGGQTLADGLGAGGVHGGYAPFNQPFGGFGFGYTQVLPSNTYVLNRYWMLVETPSLGVLPAGGAAVSVVPAQAAEPVQIVGKARAGKPARPARSAATRYGVRKSYRAAAQPIQSLPSGSLYWPGTAGAPLYSPAQRYGTYGSGYGLGAYGSIDYGSSYKGYYWGY